MTETKSIVEFQYWAFVSYSHKDRAFAEWLHRKLENFDVPDDLVGQKTGRGYQVPDRLTPIFRDVDELPTSSDLSEAINDALRDSRYLVVICSPHSAQSLWVNEEVLTFKRLGKENRILTIIVDGEPNAVDKPEMDDHLECFADTLRFRLDAKGNLDRSQRTEPIAADCRKQPPGGRSGGRERAFLKIAAGLLGVDFDDIYRRQERAERRALAIWASISSLLVAVFAGLFIYAVIQRDCARAANHDLADLVDYAIGDLQSSLKQAGRLDLLEAPLKRVEQILQNSQAKTPQSMARLHRQQAKVNFDRGNKSAAIADLEVTRDELIRESQRTVPRGLEPFHKLKRELDLESGDQRAVLEALAAVQTTLGDYYVYAGRTESARQACQDAMRIYVQLRTEAPDDPRFRLGLGYARTFLADTIGNDGKTGEAIALYQEIETLFPSAELTPLRSGETDRFIELVVRGRLGSASLLNRDHRFEDALKFLDSANHLLEAQLDVKPKNAVALEQFAVSYRQQGWLYRGLRDPVKAAAAYELARQKQERLVSIEPQNDQFKRDLGGLFISFGEDGNLAPEVRRQWLEQGLAICEEGHKKDNTNLDWKLALGTAHRVLGDLNLFGSRFQDAMGHYEKFFALGVGASAREDGDFLLQIAGGRINYARALLGVDPEKKPKHSEKALTQLAQAEAVYNEVYALRKDPAILRNEAVLDDARGDLFHGIKEYDKARNAYLEGLLRRKKLLAESTPDLRNMLTYDVAVNEERLARLDRELQNYDDATDHFKEAIELQSQVVSRLPNDQAMRLALAQFYLGKAGTMQEAGRLDGALREYDQAEKELQNLVKQVPDHRDYLREISLTNYRRGGIALDQNHAADAVTFLAESWKYYEQLFEKEDSSRAPDHAGSISNILQLEAEAESAAGQPEKATGTRRTLVERLRPLADRRPGDPRLAAAFAEAVVGFGEGLLAHTPVAEPQRAFALEMIRAAKAALDLAGNAAVAADLRTKLDQVRERLVPAP